MTVKTLITGVVAGVTLAASLPFLGGILVENDERSTEDAALLDIHDPEVAEAIQKFAADNPGFVFGVEETLTEFGGEVEISEEIGEAELEPWVDYVNGDGPLPEE